MTLKTGIRHSGARARLTDERAHVVGVDLEVVDGDVVAPGPAEPDDVPGVLDREVRGAHEDEALHRIVVGSRRTRPPGRSIRRAGSC